MESTPNIQQMEFIPQIKDFIRFTITQLQYTKQIPEIFPASKSQSGYSSGGSSSGKKNKNNSNDSIDWAFDSKDSSYFANIELKKYSSGQIATHSKIGGNQKKQEDLDNKFGNFNTPIVMKLCSKYNKSNENNQKVNPNEISALVVETLNVLLKHDFENPPKEI